MYNTKQLKAICMKETFRYMIQRSHNSQATILYLTKKKKLHRSLYKGVFLTKLIRKVKSNKLREKCPNTKFFSGLYFSVFELNTDQKKLRIWTILTQ